MRADLSDEMYRAMQRGALRRIQEQVGPPGMHRRSASEPSSSESLLNTRAQVERGWLAAAEILKRQGHRDLAWYVRRFVDALPPVRTDGELLTQALRRRQRESPQQELTR